MSLQSSNYMKVFDSFVSKIDQSDQREKVSAFLNWILSEFPELEPVIKWNQPMFTHHGTYIFGLSISKHHIAVSPEVVTMQKYKAVIEQSGYQFTENIIRIKWQEAIDYSLMKKLIQFQIDDKVNHERFWR